MFKGIFIVLATLSFTLPSFADGQSKNPAVICYQIARNELHAPTMERLNTKQLIRLCSGASTAKAPIDCYNQASREIRTARGDGSLSVEQLVELCGGA